MRCSCRNAVRDERAAVIAYLEALGQRTIATRIRDGRHLEPRTCGCWTEDAKELEKPQGRPAS